MLDLHLYSIFREPFPPCLKDRCRTRLHFTVTLAFHEYSTSKKCLLYLAGLRFLIDSPPMLETARSPRRTECFVFLVDTLPRLVATSD